MEWLYNYHAHTPYGDGHSPAAEHAAYAFHHGMRCIGISEHAPAGADVDWTMAEGAVESYRRELADLRTEYGGRLEIYTGLESDWWPSRDDWWLRNRPETWDYHIGSVHYVQNNTGRWSVDDTPGGFEQGVRDLFGDSIQAAVDAFFECERAAAASGRFNILGHFDLVKKFNKDNRYFSDTDTWYRNIAESVVRAAASSGIIVEVNTAGLDKPASEFYPAPWLIEKCVSQGVPLTLSADAHHARDTQRHFSETLAQLSQLGVQELWVLEGNEWRAAPIIL